MQGLIDQIRGAASAALSNVTAWINSAVSGITNGIASLIQHIVPVVQDVISHVVTAIQSFIGPFLTAINGMVTTVTAALTALVAQVENTFAGLFDQLKAVTLDVLTTVSNFISNAVASFQALAGSIVDAIHAYIQNTVTSITALVQSGINAVAGLVTSAASAIQGAIQYVVALVGETLAQVTAAVQAAWQELVLGADAIIATVNDRLTSLKEAFGDAADRLAQGLKDLDEKTLGKIRDSIDAVVAYSTLPDIPAPDIPMVAEMREIVSGKWDSDTIGAWLETDWFNFAHLPKIVRGILMALVQAGAVVSFMALAAETQASRFKQQLALEKPWEVLSPGDVAAAYRRRLMMFEPAKLEIRKSGFTEDAAVTILGNSSETPSEDVLISLLLRGELTPERFDQAMFMRGYQQEWIDHFKSLALEIPPLDDIIRMGRRLVFDPAIVSEFRLDDDFQEPVLQWAQKKGLSADWVHRYWQAHWDLPSVSQGFEMFQRGVITREQLDLLFRDAGMAPGWRDKLTAIAFSPLTRVDVRRMHKVGVLTPQEVFDAYKQIGYDDTNAARLRDFTVKANEAKPAHDFGALGPTSTASILGFLADGIITQPEAIDLLVKAGKTPLAAQAYVFDEVLKLERKTRADEIAHILTLVRGGLLDTVQATDALHKLNLTTPELDRATVQLLRIQRESVTLPSQAQGAAMFKAGVISEDVYADLLTTHGYAPKWVAAFVALAKGPNANHQNEG
jgi:hypothetical protein